MQPAFQALQNDISEDELGVSDEEGPTQYIRRFWDALAQKCLVPQNVSTAANLLSPLSLSSCP